MPERVCIRKPSEMAGEKERLILRELEIITAKIRTFLNVILLVLDTRTPIRDKLINEMDALRAI